jgi:hypothetical protein
VTNFHSSYATKPWGDLVAYTVGIALVAPLDRWLLVRKV